MTVAAVLTLSRWASRMFLVSLQPLLHWSMRTPIARVRSRQTPAEAWCWAAHLPLQHDCHSANRSGFRGSWSVGLPLQLVCHPNIKAIKEGRK